MPKADPRRLASWLFAVAALVFAIVVVGGITRLTESGLSITEWKPVSGVIPPLNEAQWIAEFEKYQRIPEYIEINKGRGMDLAAFKTIFFWEWVHRQLGRVIGLALALPWLWLAVRRRLPSGYTLRIGAVAALVGLQGAIGWWMVSSGLEVRTDVSHFRLSVHLLTALFIMAGLIWTALDLRALARRPEAPPARLRGFGWTLAAILFIQFLFGAWTAGLNAGQVASSWPLMNDRLFPAGVDWSGGLASTLSNDPYLIHFIHRWWAWVAVVALILLARRVKKGGARLPSIAIHTAFGIQILLGIATVMSGVNITLAVLHQAVGALLVAATVWGVHCIGRARV